MELQENEIAKLLLWYTWKSRSNETVVKDIYENQCTNTLSVRSILLFRRWNKAQVAMRPVRSNNISYMKQMKFLHVSQEWLSDFSKILENVSRNRSTEHRVM